MNKRILVTGAAGFIGSHVCERLLSQGYIVTGIDNFDPFYPRQIKEKNLAASLANPSFEFIEGDAGDTGTQDKITRIPDLVIHLAAKAGVLPSLKAPPDYIIGNILLTNKILEWMREKGIKKMIFASSSSVYGNTDVIPFREDQPVNSPFSPYAFTKRSCELMNYTYHQLYGMDIMNLRLFTVYGERQRPDLAIHKFVHLIMQKKSIHLYGDGSTSRDYTYWKDIVDGISSSLDYILAHEGVFEVINLGNNKPVKLIELVEQIAAVMNTHPDIIYEEKKPGDVDITYADISKAGKILGYEPRTSMKDGLSNFINWFKHANGEKTQ
ncbi:MAG TPA: GDP-mannose 4,6-dehydratase [Chitinophagaceae bacterium]|nr:GDP-mannose 4,6-dehydratase [Chitinophagaceae bacterium]